MAEQSLLEDTLQFAEKAGGAMLTAHNVLSQVAVEQQKAAQGLPRSVDALAATKTLDGASLISAEEKEFARRKLASHAGALEVLRNVLDEFQNQMKQAHQALALSRQGQAATTTKASAAAGPLSRSEKPDSWRRFEEALGL